MPFRGRHRLYAIFWTWSMGPFVCKSDIATAGGSKAVGSHQGCSIQLFPRGVPVGGRSGGIVRSDRGYLDVLRSDDWVFVFVDPFDGDPPEPLFLGFIDDVHMREVHTPEGGREIGIEVSCTNWDKAIQKTMCISDAWISRDINLATLWGIATQTVDNEFIPTVPNIISNITEAFLNANRRNAARQRQADALAGGSVPRERSREELEDGGFDNWSTEAGYAGEEVPAPDSTSGSRAFRDRVSISSIPGQFELPGTFTPLWDFLRMRFENIRERTFSNPQGMVNMLGMPLSRFLDEWSNPMLNVLMYDVRRVSADGLSHLTSGERELASDITGGYTESSIRDVINAAQSVSDAVGQLFEDIAPHMILMRRPLFPDELRDLDGVSLKDTECSMVDLGFTDADHYNMAWFEVASLSTSQFRLSSGLTGFDYDYQRSAESIRRHGLRIYQDQCNSWPDQSQSDDEVPSIARYDPELYRPWTERIQRAGLDEIELLTGALAIPKFVRGLYMGGSLTLDISEHPGVLAEGDRRIFFVDGYDWNYDAATGVFDTTITVTRGYSLRESTQGRLGRGVR